MTHVVLLMLKPAGSVPEVTEQLVMLPEVVGVCAAAFPTVSTTVLGEYEIVGAAENAVAAQNKTAEGKKFFIKILLLKNDLLLVENEASLCGFRMRLPDCIERLLASQGSWSPVISPLNPGKGR